jgi:hypothetical protein
MSSVAGRYGNSGQSDYATANELMNRLCCQLAGAWGKNVKVRAFCWGPWGPTKFGAGMVTEETEAKFAGMGVSLVTAEAGRRLFKEELTHKGESGVEVVCGEGPWERREAELGRIENITNEGRAFWPLLDDAQETSLPKGDKNIAVVLGENHAYLNEHRIDGVPVLPAAAALEIMSEAAGLLWPGWHVIEARDSRLLKGVEAKEQNTILNVVISQPIYGGDGGFEVSAAIRSGVDNGKPRFHYRSVLRLAKNFPVAPKYENKSFLERKPAAAKAYNEWLFHGPRFQVIRDIEGMSEGGARALLRTTSPSDWMLDVKPGHKPWVFEPPLVDAAAQMAIIWARAYRNETPLPTRFGRVARYAEKLPDRVYMSFERITSEESHLVRANVYFSDGDNNVVLLVEDLECVSSASLNRLGGTAQEIEKAPA